MAKKGKEKEIKGGLKMKSIKKTIKAITSRIIKVKEAIKMPKRKNNEKNTYKS